VKIRYLGSSLIDYVVTAEEMRSLDRRATDECGIPSLLLMENAGRAVYQAALDILGTAEVEFVVIVAGPGNNGGDGFVAARHLHNAGAVVRVLCYGSRDTATGDALTNIEIAEKMGLHIEYPADAAQVYKLGKHADLVIDALLGTGLKGDVREAQADVIDAINECDGPVLAVDIPSGVQADTGVIGGCAVNADATVTFAFPKVGLLTGAGVSYVGDLTVADISIPGRLLDGAGLGTIILDECVAAQDVPYRPEDSHKGTFGHTAIVAGSVGMTGAAALAAQGALRIGTGLVTLLVPESLNDIVEAKVTEAMTIPVPEGRTRAFGLASLDRVLEYVHKWDSVVIGPGFGRDDDTVAFTLELLRRLEKPAIVDADALYAISADPSVLNSCKAPLVITPHPGEMAALLGTTAEEVESNRLETARAFAKERGVAVVLKGAGTVVAEPDGTAYINTSGSPGMATGGTGDVLSGMIGGLLAQKLPPIHAATSAVYLHGLAGEIAVEKRGEAAMIAGDLADNIGEAINRVVSCQ